MPDCNQIQSTTPLIDDEDFPTIKMDRDVYTKLDNSIGLRENVTIASSLYPPNRTLTKYIILFLSLVAMSLISMSVYVVHKFIPLTPSINQLYLMPFLHSPSRSSSQYLDTLLNSPIIHSNRLHKRQHGVFSFLVKKTSNPQQWTDWEWRSTFNAYVGHFRLENIQLDDTLLNIFKKNVLKIERHNELATSHQFLRINQFSHLTFEQFRQVYLASSDAPNLSEGQIPSINGAILSEVTNSTLPRSINWVDRGCVTPVKDQAKCGSCWAFSSTGAIEGALCANGRPLLSLSEQELVDCAMDEGAHGCNGGYMDDAFNYVVHHHGLCSEEEYPYMGRVSECRSCKKVARIKGILSIPKDNEKAVRAALVSYGPVSAGIEADRHEFQFYHSGVFSLPCGKKLNHAILIVGYGVEETSGVPYWLVKNSWGQHWGDQGYVKLARKGHGKAGECGILLSPTAPLIGGDPVTV